MQQVGELLPVGSIVLLKGGTKKTMIMGVLQTDEEHPETVYDYMGIPYPEGYMGEESVYLFQHENINDIVLRGYENPERDEMIQVLEMIIEKTQEQLG